MTANIENSFVHLTIAPSFSVGGHYIALNIFPLRPVERFCIRKPLILKALNAHQYRLPSCSSRSARAFWVSLIPETGFPFAFAGRSTFLLADDAAFFLRCFRAFAERFIRLTQETSLPM